MKKILVLLLVLALVFAACTPSSTTGNDNPAGNTGTDNQGTDQGKDDQGTDEGKEPENKEPVENKIVYGSTTELSGNFWTSMWGNNAADAVVKDLIHGYGTVAYSKEEGAYIFDKTVVKNVESTDNADGTKTYTITINDDLVYSDKTPITAKDYVFAILAGSNPVFSEGGGNITAGYYYTGYTPYSEGTTDVFEGVRLIDDYTFSVTIIAEELPSFFDIELAGFGPWPIHIIAPNATIEDTGAGTKIAGEFNLDVINKTVLDNNGGYRYVPSVSCGPYLLDSYDTATKIAVLKINPEFKGDYNGQKPAAGFA